MDPADGHQFFGDLAFKEFYFIVHTAHVLLSRLGWYDESRDYKLTIAFFTC